MTKAGFLLSDRNEAMNWAREKLGHNTTKVHDSSGKVIGMQNKVGDTVCWGHSDWVKGVDQVPFRF